MRSQENSFLASFPNIEIARKYSERKIDQLEKALKNLDGRGISVVVNGSLARLEASAESDIDFFILVSERDQSGLISEAQSIISKVIEKPPASDGVFGSTVKYGFLSDVIGGKDDSNEKITRRILFLTEGRALIGKSNFDEERDKVLRAYISDRITDHQLALFLLNDVIRYYRTVCVDFENKTVQNGKPWGTRNIKLVFSRKMLYFGGILICAETAQKTPQAKVDTAMRLTAMTPIERCVDICGTSIYRALKEYDYFIGEISKPEIRNYLDAVTPERRDEEAFRELKNRGHQFTMTLISALTSTYPASHPIHRALIL